MAFTTSPSTSAAMKKRIGSRASSSSTSAPAYIPKYVARGPKYYMGLSLSQEIEEISRQGDFYRFKKLLREGADLNAHSKVILREAINCRRETFAIKVLEFLKLSHANMCRAIDHSASQGDLDIFRHLVLKNKTIPNGTLDLAQAYSKTWVTDYIMDFQFLEKVEAFYNLNKEKEKDIENLLSGAFNLEENIPLPRFSKSPKEVINTLWGVSDKLELFTLFHKSVKDGFHGAAKIFKKAIEIKREKTLNTSDFEYYKDRPKDSKKSIELSYIIAFGTIDDYLNFKKSAFTTHQKGQEFQEFSDEIILLALEKGQLEIAKDLIGEKFKKIELNSVKDFHLSSAKRESEFWKVLGHILKDNIGDSETVKLLLSTPLESHKKAKTIIELLLTKEHEDQFVHYVLNALASDKEDAARYLLEKKKLKEFFDSPRYKTHALPYQKEWVENYKNFHIVNKALEKRNNSLKSSNLKKSSELEI